ncbi:hypothetical protein BDQ17DRAFT_1380299, partial [Cyathus striatus]
LSVSIVLITREHLIVFDDENFPYIRSFHSSVLRERSTPPMRNVYTPPPVLNPKDMCECGPPSGALDRKRGLTQCEQQ